MKQGNSVTRDLPPTGSEANTTILFIYIGYRFPLSLSTIWGNHLQFNFHVKIPYIYCVYPSIWRPKRVFSSCAFACTCSINYDY